MRTIEVAPAKTIEIPAETIQVPIEEVVLPPKLTYTIEEVAHVLNIGLSYAYALAESGQLPTIRLGRRILVPITEMPIFLEREQAKQAAACEASHPISVSLAGWHRPGIYIDQARENK